MLLDVFNRKDIKTPVFSNAELNNQLMDTHCTMTKGCEKMLETAYNAFNLSARAMTRVKKVARTIADIEGSPQILEAHLAEAIQYRAQDVKYWG